MLPFDSNAARNASSQAVGSTASDRDVQEVSDWFTQHPNMECTFGQVFRQAIDEVLDGQRTGRYNIHGREVESTEKTYLGTKVEIITRSAFKLERGKNMDYRVAGCEVDAKFTIRTAWTIPSEALGYTCLLLTANDQTSVFSVGLLKVRDEYLNTGRNRDQKRTLSQSGRMAIKWLVKNGVLPANVLLHAPAEAISAIMKKNSGQARTTALFRHLTGQMINRNTVLTVAQQDDSPKRVRDARAPLAKEGVIVLGHQNAHPGIASALGLATPPKGSWISARLKEVEDTSTRRKANIGGTWFALAAEDEEPSQVPAQY